jgi:acetyl-CoA carboxylase carboxyltransferase component
MGRVACVTPIKAGNPDNARVIDFVGACMTVTEPAFPSPALCDLHAPVQGTVVAIEVEPGQAVAPGQVLVLIESMKMELPIEAPSAGTVRSVHVAVGDVVAEATPLLTLAAGAGPASQAAAAPAPTGPRADLVALRARLALTQDAARPEAMARRRAAGGRSARDNVADVLDAGSFSEYGALAVAAQRSRRSIDDLQMNTPADGLITGTGTVGGLPCAVMAYDYTVLAGTQGVWNHAKSDRLLELCARRQLPLVLFAEGGGGRPGDVDWHGVAGLDCTTFARLAALSGQVPLVGIVAGRCFAGNAALLGCCDLIVAVEGASLGLGGPAMIEGGGLGQVDADAVGPVEVQSANGVVDLRVPDEAAAVALARRWLSMLRGPAPLASAPGGDLSALRRAVPENRNAIYDPRAILDTIADAGTSIELRREFGTGLVTAVAQLGGRTVALAASQPRHLGGALDAPACDKLARFMQLADAHGLPLITFVDTPGFMVGPESEKTAMVRKAGRLFVTAASLRVPVLSVMLRRGYGLGAMALTAGHFHAPVATCAWPSGEFGAMGIEGAVRLGFRKELDALPPDERDALFRRLVAQAIERGRALNVASHLEIDEVIDPADTRDWLLRHLAAACRAPLPPRRGFIDAW